MAGDVEERAGTGAGRVKEPTSGLVWRIGAGPFMAVGFGQDGLTDGAFSDELAGADELGIETAVVGDGEEALMSVRGGEHGLGGGEVEGGRFFAEDVLAGVQTGDGLGRMEKDRRGHVDGVDGGGEESNFEVGEDLSAGVGGGLLGIAGDEGLEAAARLGKDGGDDAAARDVANTDDQPANHDVILIPRSPTARDRGHPFLCGEMSGLVWRMSGKASFSTGYCFLRTAAFFSSERM